MEGSTGEGGWPVLTRKHSEATNFPPATACTLWARVQRKRRQAWCDYPPAILPCFATTSLQVLRKPAAIRAATSWAFCEARMLRTRALKAVLPMGDRLFWSETYFRERDRADNFVACTCFYIAEDVGYSEAHFYWPG